MIPDLSFAYAVVLVIVTLALVCFVDAFFNLRRMEVRISESNRE